MIPAFTLFAAAAACAVQALSSAFTAVEKVPGVRRIEDKVLDNLFGPAEDFNYVSRTTPEYPPPTL